MQTSPHNCWHLDTAIWCHILRTNGQFSLTQTKPEQLQRLSKPPAPPQVSPLTPVWGRSSSPPWPTLCIPGKARPPGPWRPPCPRTGPAGSGLAGLPWPWRWSWGRGARISADPQALRQESERKRKEVLHTSTKESKKLVNANKFDSK